MHSYTVLVFFFLAYFILYNRLQFHVLKIKGPRDERIWGFWVTGIFRALARLNVTDLKEK